MATMSLNGEMLNYHDRGRGLPIVLVHGFPLDSEMWQAQVQSLADQYRVIAPDLRGFGASSAGGPFSIVTLADDLHAMLKQLDALPCLLCGFSMGGYVSLAFAKKYPSDLRGLALIDTRADGDGSTGKENRNKMIQLVRDKGSSAVAEAMLPKMVSPDSLKNRAPLVQELRRMMESQSARGIEHALAAMRDREDQTGNLASIPVPALIVVGQDDAITPPAVAEGMAKAIQNSALEVIPHAGHISPVEQPEEVTKALRRFAESLS